MEALLLIYHFPRPRLLLQRLLKARYILFPSTWRSFCKHTTVAAARILVCDCSHCVFSKHIRPKSFFKTKQQITLRNTYSTHTANDNKTLKVMRSICVILALMLFVLSSPRTTQPRELNPGLHFWQQSRVLALIPRCFMSCKN